MKKWTLLAAILWLAAINHPGLAQDICEEECRKECQKELEKCLDKAELKFTDCERKCREKYPFWADHDYMYDFCVAPCERDFDVAVDGCRAAYDECYDRNCLGPFDVGCPPGFVYDSANERCVFAVPAGYTIVEVDGKVYVETGGNCPRPPTDACCPAGFQLAIEQLCTTTNLLESCRDQIDQIEYEANLDAAQGDPVDWDWVEQQIQDILNDPNCYETTVSEECGYCYSAQLSEIDASKLTINQSANEVYHDPICP